MRPPRTTHRTDREPTANDLPQRREVRRNVVVFLRTAWSHSETRHDLVEDQQSAAGLGHSPQSLKKAIARKNEARIPHHWFEDDGRKLFTTFGEECLDSLKVVEGQDSGLLRHLFWHSRRIGKAQRRDPTACSYQEGIGMSVVAA